MKRFFTLAAGICLLCGLSGTLAVSAAETAAFTEAEPIMSTTTTDEINATTAPEETVFPEIGYFQGVYYIDLYETRELDMLFPKQG